jgi:hypothetical protein
MKRMLMIRIVALVLSCTLLAITPLATQHRASAQGEKSNSSTMAILNSSSAFSTLQEPSAKAQQGEEPGVRVLSSQILKPGPAALSFRTLNKSDEELQAVSRELMQQGYKPQTKPENHFGWDIAYQRQDGETAKVSIRLQDYAKPGSKDAGAIGSITISAGIRSDTYSFSLIAPEGNFEKVIEYRVDRQTLKVEQAHSFWTCFRDRVVSQCVGVCITALGSCLITSGGSWASYLLCLASKCGLCAAKAFGCCLCDCSWWCRWAVGCCHR